MLRQKAGYEIRLSLVDSEISIGDRWEGGDAGEIKVVARVV